MTVDSPSRLASMSAHLRAELSARCPACNAARRQGAEREVGTYQPSHRMLAAVVLSPSGLVYWACSFSWRSQAASPWLMAPAHHCTASDRVKDSSVIIACRGAPARCSVAAMWHLVLRAPSAPRCPASPGAGHAGPVHDDASRTPGMPAWLLTSWPACSSRFPLFDRDRTHVRQFRLAERSSLKTRLE
jgi:hypothetical protein